MRIAAINCNNTTFESKARGKAGAVIGGVTGLMMCGAMMATCPVDWHKIKTWPIVGVALTTGGALQGKMIADTFESRSKDKDKKE